MDNIINKIIEIDEAARDITETALTEAENIDEIIRQEKEILKKEYTDKALAQIEIIRQTEEKNSAKIMENTRLDYQIKLKKLLDNFEANKVHWEKDIYERFILFGR